jgi:Transglycosylase SLT domain
MKRLLSLAWLAAMALLPLTQTAQAQRAEYDALIATHAQANGVPEALVHRVIVRESRYQPQLVGRGGTIGLMQIKLATARGLGYTGDAAGLRDPATNLTYAVKYLAGAYRAANGDHNRAMAYYAGGYYFAPKRQRLAHSHHDQATQVEGFNRVEGFNQVEGFNRVDGFNRVEGSNGVDGFAGNLADARAQQTAAPQAGAKRQRTR